LAEYFSKRQPKRDLRLIFFSGEEMGLLGSQHYVNTNEEEVKTRGSLVMNIDVTGDQIGQNRVIVTGTTELLGYTDGITKEKGYCFDHSLDIYSSDQMPFTKFELPGISIARFGGKSSFNIHTPDDHHKNVSPEGLAKPIEAAKIILDRILNAEIYPIKREIDSTLREKIEKYFWNLSYEEPKLQWTPKYKL
jgi:Zn-dependent M28 family amino/carboxypeptidase